MYLLGIDIGTTNVKAGLFTTAGRCLAAGSCSYGTTFTSGGGAEQDPEDWYESTVGAVGELLANTTVRPEEISAIGFTTQIGTIAPLDADLHPLRPAILWSDLRSEAEVAELNEQLGETLLEVNGNLASSKYVLPHLLWLSKNEPGLFENSRYFLTPKEYVTLRLTGELVGDTSSHSGSLLIDIDRQDWSDRILDAIEIPREKLSRIQPATTVAGALTEPAARALGLRAGTSVIVGGGDNDCSAIGSGAFTSGAVAVSLGTSGIALTRTEEPLREARGDLAVYSHVIPGKSYATKMIKSAGHTLTWLKERVMDEAAASLGRPKLQVEEWLESIGIDEDSVGTSDPGLFFFPYLLGRSDPDDQQSIRAVIWGLNGSHSNRHLAMAAMEGVGYSVRDCIETMEKYVPIDRIVFGGAGGSSSVWMNIIANILGRDVVNSANRETGTLGAAILAGVGSGAFDSVEEGCAAMTALGKTFQPRDSLAAAYDPRYTAFRELSARFWD